MSDIEHVEHDPGAQADADEQLREQMLLTDLAALINRHNREAPSNTPDLVLAAYLKACLHAFEFAAQARDAWYGVAFDGIAVHPIPTTEAAGTLQRLLTVPNLVGTPQDDAGPEGLIYMIWSGKHNAWWRHDGFGYTHHAREAGRFTYAETVKYVMQSANHGRREQSSTPVAVGRA